MTTHHHRTTVPGSTPVRSPSWLFGGCARPTTSSPLILRPILQTLLAFTVMCPLATGQTPSAVAGESPLPSEDLLRYSLQVEAPATARRDLKMASDALARGDVPAAVAGWQRLATADSSLGFIPLGDSLVSPDEFFRRVLPLQPQEVRDEWRRATELWASKALKAALAGNDLVQLRRIAHQAIGSDSGRQAAIELAARSFDSQRDAVCAAACAWLLDASAPDSHLLQTTPLGLWWAVSLEQMGARDDALEIWARFHRELSPTLLEEAHRDLRLGPMIRDWNLALTQREQSATMELPEAAIAELLPSNPPAGESESQYSTLPAQVTQLLRDFESIAHPLLLLKGAGLDSPSASGPAAAQPGDLMRGLLGETLVIRDLHRGQRIYRIGSSQRLGALDALTGDQLWRTKQEWPIVLGEPILYRHAIHVIWQEASELRLTAVNAENGAENWTTRLGTEGLPRQFDMRRQWMPALGIGAGEQLLCATGNGAVVAVNVSSGKVSWVHRVSREDWRDAGPPLAPVAPHSPRMRLMAGWREPALWRAGDVIVWASPECDQLLGLDRHTGETLWTRPRGEALAAQPAPGLAVILEPRGLRAVRVADGSEVWTLETPPIAGLGFVDQGWAVVPLRTGGTIAVRLQDGRVVRGVDWDREVARQQETLPVEFTLRTLSKTADGILVRDLWEERVVPAASSLLNDQSSPAQLAAAGQLDEALSRVSEERTASGETASARIQQQLRLRLIQRRLRTQNQESPPAEAPPAILLDQISDPEERLSLAILQWRLRPDPSTATALLTAACEADSQSIELPGHPLRRVRADVAAVAALLHDGQPADTAATIPDVHELWTLSPAAGEALETAVARLERQGSTDTVDRVLNQLIGTGWGAERWLSRLEHRSEPTDNLAHAERVGFDLRLAQLEHVPGAVGERATELRKKLTIPASPAETWPQRQPKVTVHKWTSSIATRPVERSVVAQGATDRLQVDINFQNGQPRFSGAGEDRTWSPPAVKPDRSLHVVPSCQRAWLLGSMVLLQAGTRLFGISPFDADGRRDAQHLWPLDQKIDAWGTAASANVGFLPRIGDASPGSHLPDLDEFGRPLAQVGPVSMSWFGLRQFSRFVAFETFSGRQLWQTDGFDKSALACGDDGVAILLMPGRVDILSPFDGRLLRSWTPEFELSDVTELRGRTIIVFRPMTDSPGRALMAMDGVTGSILWKQPAQEGARVCSAGRFQVIVSPGTIQVLDSETGTVLAAADVETPEELADAAAISDEHGLIVLASGPPALAQARLAFQSTGGHRRPFANGRLFGFDPQSLELRWSIPMEKTVLPLDQPPDVPVLVINDAVYDEALEENSVAIGRLRCFDKRTGLLLYEGTSDELGRTANVIGRNPARHCVQVRTSKAIVRFNYRDEAGQQPE